MVEELLGTSKLVSQLGELSLEEAFKPSIKLVAILFTKFGCILSEDMTKSLIELYHQLNSNSEKVFEIVYCHSTEPYDTD